MFRVHLHLYAEFQLSVDKITFYGVVFCRLNPYHGRSLQIRHSDCTSVFVTVDFTVLKFISLSLKLWQERSWSLGLVL